VPAALDRARLSRTGEEMWKGFWSLPGWAAMAPVTDALPTRGGGDTKNPRRCDSKGLKAKAALESGNGGEQESLEEKGEWEKE